MLERQVLGDADAAKLIDGDGEGDIAVRIRGAVCIVDAADDQAVLDIERNLQAFGRLEAGIDVADDAERQVEIKRFVRTRCRQHGSIGEYRQQIARIADGGDRLGRFQPVELVGHQPDTGIVGIGIVAGGLVVDDRLAGRRQEDMRNVVGDGNVDLAVEIDEVEVAVRRADDRAEVDRRHGAARGDELGVLAVAGFVIELVEQPECEVAVVGVQLERQDGAVGKDIVGAAAVGIDETDERIADDDVGQRHALGFQADRRHVGDRVRREAIPATGLGPVRAEVHHGRERARCAGRAEDIRARPIGRAISRGRAQRQKSSDVVFVDEQRGRRSSSLRPVVLEDDLVADRDRLLHRVAVEIGDGDGRLDLAGEAQRLVMRAGGAIPGSRMLEREHIARR